MKHTIAIDEDRVRVYCTECGHSLPWISPSTTTMTSDICPVKLASVLLNVGAYLVTVLILIGIWML